MFSNKFKFNPYIEKDHVFCIIIFFIFFINTFRNKACAAPPIGHYNGSYTITLKVINVVNIRFIRCKLGSTRSLHIISNKRTNLIFKNHYFLVFKLGGPGSSKHNEGGMGVWVYGRCRNRHDVTIRSSGISQK